MDVIMRNKIWDMMDLPKGKSTIRCIWVLKAKLKYNGTIDKYKARLVAKGYAQQYGIDYKYTFALVKKMISI